ncbi:MAG: DMT family transporter [Candidatus Bipolaricaulota bacterium]
MKSLKDKSYFVYLLLTLVVFIWGLNFSLVKWAVSEISPLPFNVVRYTIASLVIFTIITVKKGWQSIPPADVVKLVLLGILGHTVYQILFIKGISLTTAGNSSLFLATSPIWTGLLSAVLGKDRLSKKAWFGTIMAFVGVFLVTLGGGKISIGESGTIGDLLVLLAAFSLSAYTVLSKDLLERYSPLRLTAFTMVIGSIGLWIFAYRPVVEKSWGSVSWGTWGVIVYSALFAVVVGYLVWFTAVKAIGPSRTAVFNNLTPIIAFALAFFLLGEPIAPLQIIGGITVLWGVSLTVRN